MSFRFCLLPPRRLACSCALFGFLLIAAVDAQAQHSRSERREEREQRDAECRRQRHVYDHA